MCPPSAFTCCFATAYYPDLSSPSVCPPTPRVLCFAPPRVPHVWATCPFGTLRVFTTFRPATLGGEGVRRKALKISMGIIRAFLCDKLLSKKFEQEIDRLFMKDSSRSLNIIIRLIFSNAY